MKRRNARNLNLLVSLTSLAVVLLAGAAYFFLYTENRADDLHQRHFRVLDRVGENMLSLNTTYLSNAEANGAQSINELNQQVLAIVNEEINRINQSRIAEQKRLNEVSQGKRKGGFVDGILSPTKNLKIIEPFPENSRVVIRPDKGYEVRYNSRKYPLSFAKFSEKYSQKTQLDYQVDILNDEEAKQLQAEGDKKIQLSPQKSGNGWEVEYSVFLQGNRNDQGGYQITLARSLARFMEPILREDIFEEFVILKRGEKVDGVEAAPEVVYETFGSYFVPELLATKIDSLLSSQIESNQGAQLDNLPYLVHLQPIQFNQERLILCGLVAKKKFDQETRKISTLIIIVLLLLIFLIVLGIPILKLGLISDKERMKISDLVFATSSAIFGTSLVILLLFDLYNYNGPGQKVRKKQLVDLSADISHNFFSELNEIYHQLTYFDTLGIPHGDDIMALLKDESYADSMGTYPHYYPFFSSVYWSNLSDSVGLEWGLRNDPSPKVSLSGRQYLERVKEGRTWPLEMDGTEGKFMLESLLTRTTGENLAVVSKPSEASIPLQGETELAPVVFLSTYMYSVIQPVLPHGFGFAIINEDGNVWFHSDQRYNLQQNFLDENSNAAIKAAMYNRSALYATSTYLGDDYSMYVKPLDQLPLYLITFRKKLFDRSVHEQIISLSFILTFLSLALGLSFIGIIVITNPGSLILKQDKYLFDWLRPQRMNRHRYQFIAIANLITLALCITFTRGAHAPVALSIIALSFGYTFLVAFFLLNRNSRNEFLWQSHRTVIFTSLTAVLLFNLILSEILRPEDALQVFLFQLIPGFILLIITGRLFYRYLQRKEKRRERMNRQVKAPQGKTLFDRILFRWRIIEAFLWHLPNLLERLVMTFSAVLGNAGFRIGTQRSYRIFLLSWLLILAVFPVIKFYEVAYNRERKLQIQHAQIELARDISQRSAMIDKRYLDVPFPDKLRDSLKTLGVYTNSFYQTQFSRDPLRVTEVDIQYMAKQGRLQLPAGTLRKGANELLLNIRFDSCWVSAKIPTVGHHVRREPAEVYPGEPNFTVQYAIQLIDSNQLAYDIRLNRKDTLSRDFNSEALDSLYADLDSLSATIMVNQVVESQTTFASPMITTTFKDKETDLETEEDTYFHLDSLLSIVRPRYNDFVRRSNYLNRNSSADSVWSWAIQSELTEVRSSRERGSVQKKQGANRLLFRQKDGLQLTSVLPSFDFPDVWDRPDFSGTRFWILFLGVLLITYFLVDFAVYRFFAQNTLVLQTPDAVSARKHLRQTKENIFLVVPPKPLETDYHEILQEKGLHAQYERNPEARKGTPLPFNFDLARAEDRAELSNCLGSHLTEGAEIAPLLVLDNFESLADNPEVGKLKLDFLNFAIRSKVQTIILSTHEPQEVSTLFSSTPTEGGERVLNRDLQKQWSQYLSNFNQFYFPLERWKVLNNQREAWAFIENKHSFLYLAKTAYRDRDLIISGVAINAENGQANMEKGTGYSDFQVIRLDHAVNTPERLNKKLDKLEGWVDKQEYKQITILSSLNPLEILRTYGNDPNEFQEERARWNRIFDIFYKGILSARPRSLRMKDRIREIIRRETAHGKFLQGIQEELVKQLEMPGSRLSNTLVEEEIILQIGIRANLYYHALWNSCTENEQLLIYDLAQDGLINSRNISSIATLLRKGIFITDEDTIQLMNRSFRNFVLTVVKPEEALKMEAQIKEDATWSRAKIPLGIIVFSVAAFLFYTDINSVVDETAAFITAVTAILPVISKLVAGIAGFNLSFEKLIPNFRRSSSPDDV